MEVVGVSQSRNEGDVEGGGGAEGDGTAAAREPNERTF